MKYYQIWQARAVRPDGNSEWFPARVPGNAQADYGRMMGWGDINVGSNVEAFRETEKPVFEVAELQAMDDPMLFIEKTAEQYSGLSLEELRTAFQEVKEEIRKIEEEKQTKP